MRHGNLPHMPGGEYVLHQNYATIPNALILCRMLARCHHVRDALDNIRRHPCRALASVPAGVCGM